jgi:hypothetical protein
MARHLKPWLTLKALEEMGGEYEGVIASVTEEPIRNRFTAQRDYSPVVTFDAGHRLIPNKCILQKLIGWFGSESDGWVGRRVRVFLRLIQTPNHKGELRSRWQRDAVCEDHLARVQVRRPHLAGDDGNGHGGDEHPADDEGLQ